MASSTRPTSSTRIPNGLVWQISYPVLAGLTAVKDVRRFSASTGSDNTTACEHQILLFNRMIMLITSVVSRRMDLPFRSSSFVVSAGPCRPYSSIALSSSSSSSFGHSLENLRQVRAKNSQDRNCVDRGRDNSRGRPENLITA